MERQHASLSEVHESVAIPAGATRWRRLLAFLGPAYLVSVGYMDPGNWATDIAGGSAFGYRLIWVLVMSNLMAMLLQSLSSRLGIVRGLDLAQASRHTYPRAINLPLYALAEIAIAACDLAEVIGMAIGLHLLFGLPLLQGVLITALDTFLVLLLMQKGMRLMEVFIISMVSVIGLSFLAQMIIVQPVVSDVMRGFVPSALSGQALYIAIGIIGATVMPHNLYLHSALVQTRKIERTPAGIREALRYNLLDTGVALNVAFLVNAAILILAASAFHTKGFTNVAEIDDAHNLLQGLFGDLAPTLFAIALIGAGQSSTVTGTLAGQIVMEGYLNLRVRPWLRRLMTRLIAITPALVAIVFFGEGSLGALLVLSQVVLSLQLGFAVVPLLHLCADRRHMKEFAVGRTLQILGWLCAAVIVFLNARLVIAELAGWLAGGGTAAAVARWVGVPMAIAFALLLLWITFAPLAGFARRHRPALMHETVPLLARPRDLPRRRICVTVDFSATDQAAIDAALTTGGTAAHYVLIHVVESAVANYIGAQSLDHETLSDTANLEAYVAQLANLGYQASFRIGHGAVVKAIVDLVIASEADLLVMGAHGHRGLKDLVLGATVDSVRHRVKVPVLVVQ
jgi:manganese transport protein